MRDRAASTPTTSNSGAALAAPAVWRKSLRSTANINCVEVAVTAPAVGVRDSKHPHGPALVFSRPRWADFLAVLGRENHPVSVARSPDTRR